MRKARGSVKLFFGALAAMVVLAALLVGCGDGNSGGDIVGDWLLTEAGYGNSSTVVDSDVQKMFYSFKPSGDYVIAEFEKVSDFWIERIEDEGKYRINGNSVCMDGECADYSVSGDILTMSSYGLWSKFVRDSRASLGKIYSQDPALSGTEWTRPSESGDANDRIEFLNNFRDRNDVYISSFSATWYTESGSRLILLGTECDRYDTTYTDGGWSAVCVSYGVAETVEFEYQLSGGTLRLRRTPADEWEVWAPYTYKYNNGQSKTKFKLSE